MNKIDVSGIFQFIAQDPVTALVVGGIFIMVIGIFILFASSLAGGLVMFIGLMLIILGIALYIWDRQR